MGWFAHFCSGKISGIYFSPFLVLGFFFYFPPKPSSFFCNWNGTVEIIFILLFQILMEFTPGQTWLNLCLPSSAYWLWVSKTKTLAKNLERSVTRKLPTFWGAPTCLKAGIAQGSYPQSLLDEKGWGVSLWPEKSPHPPHSSSLSSAWQILYGKWIWKNTVCGICISFILFHFLDQKAPFSPTMEEETKQFGERTRGKYCHGFYKKHQKKNVN